MLLMQYTMTRQHAKKWGKKPVKMQRAGTVRNIPLMNPPDNNAWWETDVLQLFN